MAALTPSESGAAAQHVPLSSINLEDTVANFPSLKRKYARSGMSEDRLTITCPISGSVLTSSDPFELLGDFGFEKATDATTSIVGLTGAFSTEAFLLVLNRDTIGGNTGGVTFGSAAFPQLIVSDAHSIKYTYFSAGIYSSLPALAAGDTSAKGCAVSPEFDFHHEISVWADGTTASSAINAPTTGTFDQDWSVIPEGLKLPTNGDAILYSIYVLSFANGLPSDLVIAQGLEWMADNRDKGLPPHWKGLE